MLKRVMRSITKSLRELVITLLAALSLSLGQAEMNNSEESLKRLNYFRNGLSFLERTIEQDPETELFVSPYSSINDMDGIILFHYIRLFLVDSSMANKRKIIEKVKGKMKETGIEEEIIEPFLDYLRAHQFNKSLGDSAFHWVNEAEKGYKKIKFNPGLVDCYAFKAELLLEEYKKTKEGSALEEAKRLADKGLEMAEKNNDIVGVISTYKLLWEIAKLSKDPDEYFYYSLYCRSLEEEKKRARILIENLPEENLPEE